MIRHYIFLRNLKMYFNTFMFDIITFRVKFEIILIKISIVQLIAQSYWNNFFKLIRMMYLTTTNSFPGIVKVSNSYSKRAKFS